MQLCAFDSAVAGVSGNLKQSLIGLDVKIKDICSEIRLRINKPIVLVCNNELYALSVNGRITKDYNNALICTKEIIQDTFSRMCDYSVHTYQSDISRGFVTVAGGHRVGIAGTAVTDSDGNIITIRDVSSLNIRIARQVKGCSADIFDSLFNEAGKSILIAGPPAAGKTTLLRDIVRMLSDRGNKVCVIDERQEIASMNKGVCLNDLGMNTDVYYGYSKEKAINMAVRTMSPDVIAVDEICEESEVRAIERASNCGIELIVTVHAESLSDIVTKYQTISLLRTGAFDKIVILSITDGIHQKSIYDIEEINDEIYRRRAYLDKFYVNGDKCFSAV